MKILLHAELEKFEPRADRSYKLTFGTPELSGEEAEPFGHLLRKSGVLYYSEQAMSDQELSDIDKLTNEDKEIFGDKAKTKSQRLRGVLFRYWESLGGKGKFDDFYNQKMEGLIDLIKSKIE